MRKIVKGLREQAKKNPRKIIFPEANDERIIEAVERINQEKIANALLLTHDNLDVEKQEKYANIFHERKKAKGVSFEEARELMENPLYYAAMMVKYDSVDGFVAGAKYTTSSVIKAALNCLDLDKTVGTIYINL
ncbi:MAG: phosphate acyltransferase [Candidatus Omnitrophota bacterium]